MGRECIDIGTGQVCRDSTKKDKSIFFFNFKNILASSYGGKNGRRLI